MPYFEACLIGAFVALIAFANFDYQHCVRRMTAEQRAAFEKELEERLSDW